MQRVSLALGILGLACAAAVPASAQQVTLFGKTYNVVKESRAQTYKKQGGGTATVVLPDSGNQKANLFFAEGADASRDRLFVVCPILGGGPVAHQFYLLTGSDANGAFSKDAATITEFFGGAQDDTGGGRPTMVCLLNEENTGVKRDRNIALHTLAGTDAYRYFDLDSLSGNYLDATVFSRDDRGSNADAGDPKAPAQAFGNYCLGPNGTMVVFARPEAGGGIGIGVTDPKKDEFFDVLTNVIEVTASSTKPIPEGSHASGAVRYAATGNEGEDWVLFGSGAPDGDNDSTDSSQIARLKLTFPTDLSKGTPGSIKVDVLDISQELKGTALGGASEGAMFGIAAGREVAPGLRRLYFADWAGNLYTATPVP